MSPWVHRTMIVPVSHVVMARNICATLPPSNSGAGMFTTPLSALGILPATHYISAGMIQQEFADLMDNPTALYAACQAAGLPYTQLQITLMLGLCTISKPAVGQDPNPLGVILGLALKIIGDVL